MEFFTAVRTEHKAATIAPLVYGRGGLGIVNLKIFAAKRTTEFQHHFKSTPFDMISISYIEIKSKRRK
jgi:hypothetical protein